jgi:thiamine biosynthesis lipoprotein
MLAAARERVGFQHVTLDPAGYTVRFTRPGMSLDLGAIGKGYAVERAAALLRDVGVPSALLHGGTSSVYGLGSPTDSDGWAVALRDPTAPEGGERHLAQVRLRDRALSVSAPHGKTFVAGGARYGHVLDPRRGLPVQSANLAALVTDSPTDGDALSTALLVLGKEGEAALRAFDPTCRGLVMGVSGIAPIGNGGDEITLTANQERA